MRESILGVRPVMGLTGEIWKVSSREWISDQYFNLFIVSPPPSKVRSWVRWVRAPGK